VQKLIDKKSITHSPPYKNQPFEKEKEKTMPPIANPVAIWTQSILDGC
jgi:hypothetical protein